MSQSIDTLIPWETPPGRRPYWPDGDMSPELTDDELRANGFGDRVDEPFGNMSWHRGFVAKYPNHPSSTKFVRYL